VALGLLISWHIARPRNHALDAAIFLLSLAIVWLGVELAHQRSRSRRTRAR
jgi:hypothetical protein